MPLEDDIEEFRAKISQIVGTLEEVSSSSGDIPNTDQRDLSSKFNSLDDGLENVSTQLRNTTDLLNEIRNTYGRG